ncbi:MULTISPECIES: dienelactone hydrolase family protein [unclassified Acinetobacter]|uniref:dienelactone hydrolase family protein n=1 Tax=unclassified Acinetobacter TaxID=196816 RepID=UPI0035BB3252
MLLKKESIMDKIQTTEVHYQDSHGQNLIGYLAYPNDSDNKHAAILVFPEWWGRNAYIEQRARELAELGYVALAVDMYGDKKLADDPQTANQYMMATFEKPDTIVDRATAAMRCLQSQKGVDATKIAAIGFCYGGKVALDLARSNADLKVVATFHANLSHSTPANQGFRPKVLVSHGEIDTMVTLDDVEKFKQEMQNAGVDYQVDIYPNAKHGFTNPKADENAAKYGVDLGYNADAAKQSIAKMHKLMADYLT